MGTGGRAGFLELATDSRVVGRALLYALGVGSLLIAINHGDAVLSGNLSSGQLVKMGLTALVPYAVSTLSSVSAMRGSPH